MSSNAAIADPATIPDSHRPAPASAGDNAFVRLAATIGEVAARHSATHDRENTFVAEAYAAMAEHDWFKLLVPKEFGGLGATLRQAVYAQHELAQHDGATALASLMHQYNTYVQVVRYEKGAPGAEGFLKKVTDGAIVMTSGGSDWLDPDTIATPVEGGYRVSGRKRFGSQTPVATLMTTMASVGEPGPGAEVIHFGLPRNAEGITVEETWDTMGMRGTASHDSVLRDVFVPEAAVSARREWGHYHPSLLGSGVCFAPLAAATYLGIARAARNDAAKKLSSKGDSPIAQRAMGEIDAELRNAWFVILGALAEVESTFDFDANTFSTLMLAKRHVVLAAIRVVDLSMEAVGGSSYYRRTPMEQRFRDVRAGTFHPLTPEKTLVYAGKVALGGDAGTE